MKNPRDHEVRMASYDRAVRQLQSGDFDGAAPLFAELSGPQDLCGLLSRFYAGECYLRVGLAHLRSRDFDRAVESLEQAARFKGRHQDVPRFLGCCFAQLGRFDEALRFSERETNLVPEDTAARTRFALSLWRDGQQDAAVQALREGIAAQPHNAEWHFQLGVLLGAREEYASAIETLERVMELDPTRADAILELALCFGAQGDCNTAADLLLKAQQLSPHDASVAHYLALAARGAGHVQCITRPVIPPAPLAVDTGGIEELTRMLRHEPEIAETFTRLSEEYRGSDILDLVAAVLDRAILQEPLRAELHYRKGQIYTRIGRPDLAIASCERAVEIDPGLVQALVTLGKLYREARREKDAEARFQKVLELGYEYADVHFHLGCIYRDLGEPQRAALSYRRALDINSQYGAARAALESLAA